MELVTVDLTNVRSFAHATIRAGPGFIRIAGENGAGKSTIVAGIAFAFLGPESVESRRYVVSSPEGGTVELDASSKLLRRGQAWGLAAVTFRVGERTFRVHRVLGKRPRVRGKSPRDPLETEDAALVVLGPDGTVGEVVETNKREVAAAVAKLLDLPVESFVHAFKRIVAAPQGKLLQAIFEESKERREIYWRILGVDRYARAFADATRMGALLEARYLRGIERAVAAAEQEVKDLGDAPELARQLGAEVLQHEGRLTERRGSHDGVVRAREQAADALGRARSRAQEAERLLAERAEVLRENELARGALEAADQAARRLKELDPEVARFAALRAEQPARRQALAAYEAARAAYKEARRREEELRERDRCDSERVKAQLAEAKALEEKAQKEHTGLGRQLALARRESASLGPEADKATQSREALGRWLARVKPPLARLLSMTETAGTSAGTVDELARSAPPARSPDEQALAGRAAELADEVTRLSGSEGEARARVEACEDLASKVGSGAMCPFLAVSCPHPKGQNLLATVRDKAKAERKTFEAARRALEAARAQQKLAVAAQEKLERHRAERQAWTVRVARSAPPAVAWLEAWDRERSELGCVAAEAPPSARALVQGLATGTPTGKPIGQVRLFESGAAGPAPFMAPEEWDSSSLQALARGLRARCSQLEGAMPSGLEDRLEELEQVASTTAADLVARRDASVRRLQKLEGQAETAPAQLEQLACNARRRAEEEGLLQERHARDAAARAAEVAARQAALAALEPVPVENERFERALEAAQRADAEAHRCRGIAEQAPAVRERVERAKARAGELGTRIASLGAAGDPLAVGVLEAVATALAKALDEARGALEAARAAEEASGALLVEAEGLLRLVRHRLGEASRRVQLLGERRVRLERLRQARDHVAHACSALRGGPAAGPLGGALYRALSDLPGRLAERRVREVSSHARRIYRAIAPAEAWDLMWDQRTYVLALGAPGSSAAQAVREGIAIDDMSGGQQMSAALALHLALVHTYARNCDVLFLDEPTTHLDTRRKQALAECLRSLRARVEGLVPLRQIFVISHDDAFEGLQDHVIRVVAGKGGESSRIEDAAPIARARAAPLDSPPIAQRKPRRKKQEVNPG